MIDPDMIPFFVGPPLAGLIATFAEDEDLVYAFRGFFFIFGIFLLMIGFIVPSIPFFIGYGMTYVKIRKRKEKQ